MVGSLLAVFMLFCRIYQTLINSYTLSVSAVIPFTGPCPVLPRDTLPMTVSLSPTLEQGYCVLLTWIHWVSTEHQGASGTGSLQLLPQEFGTVCRQTYERQSCHIPGSGGRWRHFIWTVRPRRIVNFCFTFFAFKPFIALSLSERQ